MSFWASSAGARSARLACAPCSGALADADALGAVALRAPSPLRGLQDAPFAPGTCGARVYVMPKAGVLDPQGKAIGQALAGLGFAGVQDVRAGKVIELELAETDPARARAAAEEMARKLLANTVIESFRVEVT